MYIVNNTYYYHGDSNTLVNSQIKDLYLRYSQPRRIDPHPIKLTKNTLLNNLSKINQVTFEMTRDCNLNCTYCIYSSNEYPLFQRKDDTPHNMQIDTAFNTLRIIRDLLPQDDKTLTIGFFGGEPLLQMDTIKKIVSYAGDCLPGRKLRFTITTNGVLITPDIADYLANHSFSVLISLDGDITNHDAKRVFKDGTGSFTAIRANLRWMKESNPQHYAHYVTFAISYSPDLPYENLCYFFLNDELVCENDMSVSFVNSQNTAYFQKYPHDEKNYREVYRTALESIIKKLRNKTPLKPLEKAILAPYATLNGLLSRRYYHSFFGSCVFNSKLYVDTVGRFHICEKMNSYFPIGDAVNGFDTDAILRIADSYGELIGTYCRDCDIRFLCSRCYIHFAQTGFFHMEKDFCDGQRGYVARLLEYILIIHQAGGFLHDEN